MFFAYDGGADACNSFHTHGAGSKSGQIGCEMTFKAALNKPIKLILYSVYDFGKQFIVNLSTSNTSGSHFIALSIKNDYCLFFDSFGKSCTNSYIIESLYNQNKNIIYSNIQIQDFLSHFCGYFCLAFLINDFNGKSLTDFLAKFNEKDLLTNDEKTVNIIVSHIENKMK